MSDLSDLSSWQLRELEHYAKKERYRRERGEAISRGDFAAWAINVLKVGVEYIDYAWNWLLNLIGLRD
jgi:hypothetical protein